MHNDISHIFNEAKKISLSEGKKGAIRAHLIARMSLDEAFIPSFHTDELMPIPSRFVFSSLLVFVKRPLPAALLVVVLLGGSAASVASAAEGAVPGDTLYSFKVNVNEGVASFAALTPEAKREWNTTRIERRLLEAEELAANGRLNEDASAVLTGHIALYIDALGIRDEETTAIDVLVEDADFDARISAHERILSRLAAEEGGVAEAETILLAVRPPVGKKFGERGAVQKSTSAEAPEAALMMATDMALEAQIAPSPSVDEHAAQRMHKLAEESYDRAIDTLEDEGGGLSNEVIESVEDRIEAAAEALHEGGEKLTEGEYAAAFALFKEALQISEEARIVVLTAGKIHTGVVESARSNDTKNKNGNTNENEKKKDEEAPHLIHASAPAPEPMPYPGIPTPTE